MNTKPGAAPRTSAAEALVAARRIVEWYDEHPIDGDKTDDTYIVAQAVLAQEVGAGDPRPEGTPNPSLRAEMVEALRRIEEVINEAKETSAPMPHVYRQGWQDACEKVLSEVYRSFGRVDGVVREVAAAARVAQLEKGLWSLLELKADCDSERLLEMVQQHARAILTKADSESGTPNPSRDELVEALKELLHQLDTDDVGGLVEGAMEYARAILTKAEGGRIP